VSYLIDGDPGTEYSSASKGVGTFVEFDFGRTVMLAGVKHVDRNDPATVGGRGCGCRMRMAGGWEWWICSRRTRGRG
jgi:hypothetical protein